MRVQRNNTTLNIAKYNNSQATIIQLAVQYLDALAGVNTPDFLCRKRSPNYQNESRLAIERFLKALKEKDYRIDTIKLDELTDNELGIYHDSLKKLGIQARTYNKHIAVMKAFVNWAIRTKDQNVINIFSHIQLRATQKESAIILKEEFERLIEVIEPRRSWLKNAFRLALETGVRREELAIMRWSDVVEIGPEISVVKLNNLKVNRIESGFDDGRCKYIPLTKSLMVLLHELGYNEKKGTGAFILSRPEGYSNSYMMNTLSRSFAHYIKLVTDRKLEFRCLRKTYLTYLTLALGEKAKIFSGHSDSAVLRNHYLNEAFLVGNMNSFSIF